MERPHYRCTACGNITRFDVVVTSTIKEFHHFSVGGDVTVDNVDVLSSHVDSVSCRWCGHGKNVEVIDKALATGNDQSPQD